MSRYIDADALKKRIMNNWYTATEISDDIDAEPTADVEKVVRCKDCIHRPYEIPAKYDRSGKCIKYAYITSPDDVCPYVCEDSWYNHVPEDNFFCGFGDRKETKLTTNLQPTCNQLATNLQPTCNQLATNLQPTCNQLATNLQPTCNQLAN